MTTTPTADIPRDPRIKPLVWSCSDDANEDWIAESPFGPFNAYFDEGHGWLVQLDGHDDTWAKYPDPDFGFANAHLARNACEAEYLRRADLLLVDTPAQTATSDASAPDASVDPMQKMTRFRFYVPGDDPRPIAFPPSGPFWCTGYSDTHCVVVAYAPDLDTLTSATHWPDAEDIDAGEEPEVPHFSSRFQRPGWWPAPVTFAYTNYKGEHGIRTVTPQRIWYGCTQYHPNNGWLLTGYDHDKKAMRDFALTDIEFLNVTEEGS